MIKNCNYKLGLKKYFSGFQALSCASYFYRDTLQRIKTFKKTQANTYIISQPEIAMSALFVTEIILFNIKKMVSFKEYRERRHGEPFKVLLLPKMGLLGSQASTRKKKSNFEL